MILNYTADSIKIILLLYIMSHATNLLLQRAVSASGNISMPMLRN